MNWCRRVWLIAVFALLIGVTACQSETILQFETIEQRDYSGTGKEIGGKTPAIVVVSSSTTVAKLTGLITADAQAKLQSLNYNDYVVVAVFQGWKPSTGYSIQIERIVRTGDHVKVYVKLHEPRPEEPKGAAITSPYHLVQVRRIENWRRTMLFYLIIDGVEVQNEVGVFEAPAPTTESEYPIPKTGQSPLVLPTLASPVSTPVYPTREATKQPALP